MPDQEITDLPLADPLDGTEFLVITQGGNSRHTDLATVATLVPIPDLTQTSSDTETIGTGSKTFTFDTPSLAIGWTVGTRVRAVADPSNYMGGPVTAVTLTDVTIDMETTEGSGSFSSWDLGISGEPGADGAAGPAPETTRSSTDSISLGTGTKTLNYTATAANIGWAIGTRLRFYNDATHYMEGVVTAVSSTAVTITSDNVVGTGTLATWTISIAGDKGATGSTGAAGSSWPGFTVINKVASYTAVTSDFSGNKMIEFDSASAVDLTIDTGLTGVEPLLVWQKGAGQITVNGTATRRARNGSKSGGQYALFSVTPCATDVYIIAGDTTT